MIKSKTTHAQDISQRINIDVAIFMAGKSAASIDEILPVAAAPAIHTDFKNTENKDMRAVMRSMRLWVKMNKRFLNLTKEAAIEGLAKEWLPTLEDDYKASLLQDIKVLKPSSITEDGMISPDEHWLSIFERVKNSEDRTKYGVLAYGQSLATTTAKKSSHPKVLLDSVDPDSLLAQKLAPYIEWYKVYYQHLSREEDYKWKATNTFQKEFDIAAKDLAVNLKAALADEYNLLSGNMNFSKAILIKCATKQDDEELDFSEQTRYALSCLFDEEKDFVGRVEEYVAAFDNFHAKRIAGGLEKPNTKHHQNPHAISVLLAFRYPTKYYIFKETVWNNFKYETGVSYPSLYHFRYKLLGYDIICDQIRQVLIADEELTARHDTYYVSERYKDPSNYHLMTQDFLYAIAVHFAGFDRLPQFWEEDKDEMTDEISDYLKRHQTT